MKTSGQTTTRGGSSFFGEVTPKAGAMVRHDASGTSVELRSELGAGALAARERAQVEAAFAIARHAPRDVARARTEVLAMCERLAFAEAAVYERPTGGRRQNAAGKWEDELIQGLSIRFAEDARIRWRNIHTNTIVWSEDDEKRIIRVSATDMESNSGDTVDVVVLKQVERSNPGDRQVLSSRQNSEGKSVFLCVARPDEVSIKERAESSKARRNLILALLPADLKEAALDACKKTMLDAATEALGKDRKGVRVNVLAAFSRLGVTEVELVAYLGHDLEQMTPEQLAGLRMIREALENRETTWDTVFEARTGQRPQRGTQAPPAPAAPVAPPAKPAATVQPAPPPPPASTPPEPPAREPGEDDDEAEEPELPGGDEPAPSSGPLPESDVRSEAREVKSEPVTPSAPKPVAVTPAKPSEPPPGTEEFAEWLMKAMVQARDDGDDESLSALAKRSGGTPGDWPKRLGRAFTSLRAEIRKNAGRS
jgi:hypothetical protein